jgi:hypothetical protein
MFRVRSFVDLAPVEHAMGVNQKRGRDNGDA